MKAALQQAGIAGVADLGVQWSLVKAGVQDKIDGWRTVGVAAGAAAGGTVVGAITPVNRLAFPMMQIRSIILTTNVGQLGVALPKNGGK